MEGESLAMESSRSGPLVARRLAGYPSIAELDPSVVAACPGPALVRCASAGSIGSPRLEATVDAPFLVVGAPGPEMEIRLEGWEQPGAVEVTGHLGQEELVGIGDRPSEYGCPTDDPDLFIRVLCDQLIEVANGLEPAAQWI